MEPQSISCLVVRSICAEAGVRVPSSFLSNAQHLRRPTHRFPPVPLNLFSLPPPLLTSRAVSFPPFPPSLPHYRYPSASRPIPSVIHALSYPSPPLFPYAPNTSSSSPPPSGSLTSVQRVQCASDADILFLPVFSAAIYATCIKGCVSKQKCHEGAHQ